ncbi:MAG: hypothetical protein NC548_32550 [Lachnospiraceae bacterium]|nr:hypothetical protein [Lachnospiraceae bacterium]
MKKYLYMLLAAAVLCGCSKEDDGPTEPDSSQFIRVQVPKLVLETTSIRVDVEIPCDEMPTITFATANNLLGVVSPVEKPDFDTDYVYSGEPIDVQYSNGHATASFWYIPLTRGDGNHVVSFTVNYTSNGEAKSATTRKVLNVEHYSGNGFYPEAYGDDPGYYYFRFKNELNGKEGCDFRIAFVSLNDETNPENFDIYSGGKRVEKNIFYTWKPDRFGKIDRSLVVYDEGLGEITVSLICRDKYHRCRDLVFVSDAEGTVTTSTYSEYYLWNNKK